MAHACRGVFHLVRTQPNARIHVLATMGTVALGVWLNISPLEWAVLALAIGLVLCAEALNTAIEHVVDLVSPQWHPLARDAKDVAAGAVLLASLAALGVGAGVFGTRLWAML